MNEPTPNEWYTVILFTNVKEADSDGVLQMIDRLNEIGTYRALGGDYRIRECKVRSVRYCDECDCITAEASMSEEFIRAQQFRNGGLYLQ